jgi:hypothetical protein
MERKEGDVWTEKGKTWTIKNGIKKSVTKFDSVRKDILEPLACPECGKKMKHRNDSIMWRHHKKCFDCVIVFETELIRTGKFEEYEKNKIKANVETFIKDLSKYADEYLLESGNKSYVTEDGDVEDWVGGYTKEQVDDIIKPQVEKVKQDLHNYVKGSNTEPAS